MCFQKNKKIILLLIFVFVIIYLLTKHNEHFDISNVKYDRRNIVDNSGNLKKKSTSVKPKGKQNMTNEYYYLNNNKLNNNLIDNSEFINGIINNTRMNSSEINMSEINDPTINNPYINNLSTTGDIRFTGQYTENKNTYNREPFVLLLDKTKKAEDYLLINTSGRSSINLNNSDSHIQIGDQLLDRNKLAFLNKLYTDSPQSKIDTDAREELRQQSIAREQAQAQAQEMPQPQFPQPQMPSPPN